jgi:predicted DNA-binding transcriptional regulator AlpA
MNTTTVIQISKEDLYDFLSEINQQQLTLKRVERYLTVDEVIKLTGKVRSTLWSWEQKGYLVPSRLGKEIRYLESDVLKLMGRKEEHNEF